MIAVKTKSFKEWRRLVPLSGGGASAENARSAPPHTGKRRCSGGLD